MLTSGGEGESPTWQRIFWAIIEGIVAATLLLAGGLGALQAATIASALPFTVIMVFMCWGLYRALSIEGVKRSAANEGRLTPLGHGGPRSWKRRLEMIVSHPKRPEVEAFLLKSVEPAFSEVVGELRKRGLEAAVNKDEDGRLWIEVRHGEDVDFYYSVHPRAYEPPAFALDDTTPRRLEELKYFRAEIFLREGSQNYDIMGWAQESIINDVLDHYERHLRFIASVRGTKVT
ncbi:MAG: BCCT family transporter [Opitutales bacterium]|nr:BCCT family transporter [Opitutales bacterium]